MQLGNIVLFVKESIGLTKISRKQLEFILGENSFKNVMSVTVQECYLEKVTLMTKEVTLMI